MNSTTILVLALVAVGGLYALSQSKSTAATPAAPAAGQAFTFGLSVPIK